MNNLVLASSSPRRIEILKALNIDFDIVPSNYDEVIIQKSPYALVTEFAIGKAMEVANRINFGHYVLAADTIVYKDGEILGKPKSSEDAKRILNTLSNSSHSVITGICVIDLISGNVISDYEETIVHFKSLSEDEINDYIITGEPLDKAGAYGIQGYGSIFVKKIEGCYFNVVGLPIYKLNIILGSLGVNLLKKGV